MGLLWWLNGKKIQSPAKAGDTRDAGSIPGLGSSLEKEMAIHSSILAWKSQGQKSLTDNSQLGRKRVRHDLATESKDRAERRWDA